MPRFVMPNPVYESTTMQWDMHLLMLKNRKDQILDDCDFWGIDESRYLLGYVIPPFQRPLVWTVEQQVKFIESAWLGFHLGTYVVNRLDAEGHPMSHVLIDGLQRLTTIKAYIEDKFPVFNHYFSELPPNDQGLFRRIPFTCQAVNLRDETVIRDVYNRLNFGGTPHTEDQRA